MFKILRLGICACKVVYYFLKIGWYHRETFILWPFLGLGKWKIAFLCDEKEIFLLQHYSPSQDAHVCTIWEHYINYAMNLAITLVVRPESHETSNVIGDF
jgi:hypothetical protein